MRFGPTGVNHSSPDFAALRRAVSSGPCAKASGIRAHKTTTGETRKRILSSFLITSFRSFDSHGAV